MKQAIQSFTEKSLIARKVHLRPKIVLHRTFLSTRDIVNIRKQKSYGLIPEKEKLCELEVGGQILTKGKIIKKRGEYFFKIEKLFSTPEKCKEKESGGQ